MEPQSARVGGPRWLRCAARQEKAFGLVCGPKETISCSVWGCDERLFHIWWMQHLPHVAGVASDGSSNNWRTYILAR
jgi:hypothetical protein